MGITKIDMGDINLVDFIVSTGWDVIDRSIVPENGKYPGIEQIWWNDELTDLEGRIGILQVLPDEVGPFSIIKVDKYDLTVVNINVNNGDVLSMVAEMDSDDKDAVEILNKFPNSFDVTFVIEAKIEDVIVEGSKTIKEIHTNLINHVFGSV